MRSYHTIRIRIQDWSKIIEDHIIRTVSHRKCESPFEPVASMYSRYSQLSSLFLSKGYIAIITVPSSQLCWI